MSGTWFATSGRLWLAGIVTAGLCACAIPGGPTPAQWIHDKVYRDGSTYRNFTICRSYGCTEKADVAMPESEWRQISNMFHPRPETPDDERHRIAWAIAYLEHAVGRRAGFADDAPESFRASSRTRGQLDCLDETHNTMTFLKLMLAEGLIRFHDIDAAAYRGHMFDMRWPHNTAVIAERDTGARYTVDSYFHANGALPEIIPLEVWQTGWVPEDRGQASLDFSQPVGPEANEVSTGARPRTNLGH